MSNPLKTIPLCQLQRAKTNVRKTGKTADLEQLAASIEVHGLLENLVVTAAGCKDEPLFDVIAGGRRHAALNLLVKRGTIAPDFPVPCLLRKPNGASLSELSLAENLERAPLHPADQFEAFAKLHTEELSAEDIALRFGLTSTLVAQRLKLAAVSPRLIAEYRKGEMTLEQLIAFAISDDRQMQETFWFDTYGDRSPHTIRRALTKAHVDGNDRRARFVGAKTYEEAGGIVLRDLFDAEDEGYFTDSVLLDRLATEKLQALAEPVRSEGWQWVEVTLDPDVARAVRFSRIHTVEIELSKKDEKRLARLAERYDALVSALEETGDETSEEFDKVSEELAALQAQKEVWPDGEKSRAGVLISLDWNGAVVIDRGLVRPEDRAPEATRRHMDGDPSTVRGPYPESLLLDLSAQRTAALREVLAANSKHALTALLVCLADAVVLDGASRGCIGIGVQIPDLERASKTVDESKAQQGFRARQDQWQERLQDRERLWELLDALDISDRLALLAHCVSATVNGLWQRSDTDGRHAGVNRLSLQLGLDMADWWRPKAANFFCALTKAQIVETVREAVSPADAERMSELKKSEMAEQAERVLKEARWLPGPLRQSANPETSFPVQ